MLNDTVQILKDKMPETGYLDVGTGLEKLLGINKAELLAALAVLREQEGFIVWRIHQQHDNSQEITIVKLLGRPDSTFADARRALRHNEVHAFAN